MLVNIGLNNIKYGEINKCELYEVHNKACENSVYKVSNCACGYKAHGNAEQFAALALVEY